MSCLFLNGEKCSPKQIGKELVDPSEGDCTNCAHPLPLAYALSEQGYFPKYNYNGVISYSDKGEPANPTVFTINKGRAVIPQNVLEKDAKQVVTALQSVALGPGTEVIPFSQAKP